MSLEIHLHPEAAYIAELIVLLEKYLHLTILITTHSPYFLEAIETYTKKHNVDHITNYYLAQADGKETVYERCYRKSAVCVSVVSKTV